MAEKVCLPYFIHIGRQIDVLRQAGYFRRIRNDTVDISRAGRNALENKMSALNRAGQNKAARKLSPVSSFSVISDFERAVSAEKEEGIKSNTFDCHVNQMVSAYKRMRNGIEEKYADTDRKQRD